MVRLEEIKKINNIVSAYYVTETESDGKGYIEYDIEKKQVVKYEYSEWDKQLEIKTSFYKAIKAIEKVIKNGNYPKTYTYYWY